MYQIKRGAIIPFKEMTEGKIARPRKTEFKWPAKRQSKAEQWDQANWNPPKQVHCLHKEEVIFEVSDE
jgi:hypothetical protein